MTEIQAWKDPEQRSALGEIDHPAGLIRLDDDTLAIAYGGAPLITEY
jgi:mersacidin/lichenicidin family type 2 lantibiotic